MRAIKFGNSKGPEITKKQILSSMKELPESFSAEEIIDKIILLQKIDIGLEQSKNGKVVSEIDARKKLKKWLK
jgi:hypothetical protein